MKGGDFMLTRAWYWVTFSVKDGKRGAIHDAKNCASFVGGEADVRIGKKKAQALLDRGKSWLCKRCSGMK